MNTNTRMNTNKQTAPKKLINFIGMQKPAMILSLFLVIASVGSLIVNGLNMGVDFTGGTVVEVGYPDAAELQPIRKILSDAKYEAQVQHFGSSKDVLIRISPPKRSEVENTDKASANKSKVGDEVYALLKKTNADIILRRAEFVGPQIGEELRDDGGLAMLLALAGILIYVTLRFEFRFSLGAIAALLHDVIITIGIFSIFRIEFDLTILAAILAIIGYSLNDTIVVFDRVRENFLNLRKADAAESINISINQTLSRTIVTSLTTVLVLVALFLLGGKVIHGFALAMIIGVAVGTYSSIYVASSSLLMMGITRDALLAPKKDLEGREEDGSMV